MVWKTVKVFLVAKVGPESYFVVLAQKWDKKKKKGNIIFMFYGYIMSKEWLKGEELLPLDYIIEVTSWKLWEPWI